MPEMERQMCSTCNGEAVALDGTFCPDCMGTGAQPVFGTAKILKDIQAEQASQRTDLTTALEAIWNKVKNL